MLRLLCFIGAGILLGGIVSAIVGPPGAAAWAVPVGIIVTVFSAVMLGIGKSLRGVSLPAPELVTRATDDGRLGLARIDRLTQTGTYINEQPLCDLELTVQPLSGAAYRTTVRRIVQLTEIPRFQPGSTHVVALLAAGTPDVAITEHDASAEIWSDTEVPPAATAGPLLPPSSGGLTRDGSGRRPLIGMGKRSKPIRITLFVLAGLLAGAAVVFPYRAGLAETVAAIPQGQLHADLRTGDSLAGALTALTAEIGHDQVRSITVSSDLVRVESPVKRDSLNVDSWYYRRGSVTHTGAGSTQPKSASELFSVSELDGAAVQQALQDAARLVDDEIDTKEALADAMYSVERTLAHDPDDPWNTDRTGPVTVNFSLSDAYRSTSFRVEADGSDLVRTDQ